MRYPSDEELAKAREAAGHMESALKKYPWIHPLLSPEEKERLRKLWPAGVKETEL